METTREQLEQRLSEYKAKVAEIEKQLQEPKDGEWYETNYNGRYWIFKLKQLTSKEKGVASFYILINKNGYLEVNSWCHSFDKARKITPEEALPYFKAYFEKQGFKEGCKFMSAGIGITGTFNEVTCNRHDFDFFSIQPNLGDLGIKLLFNNYTNTFATLVEEEKIEPLDFGGSLVTGDDENIEITITERIYVNKGDKLIFSHSEIEQIYKYSQKAQGK